MLRAVCCQTANHLASVAVCRICSDWCIRKLADILCWNLVVDAGVVDKTKRRVTFAMTSVEDCGADQENIPI